MVQWAAATLATGVIPTGVKGTIESIMPLSTGTNHEVHKALFGLHEKG